MTMYVSSAAERVRAAVRAQDPARYHCALFAPAPARAGLFAMIATMNWPTPSAGRAN